MSIVIDGKKVAEKIKEEVKKEVADLFKQTGEKPGLAVVLVGDDPASQVYVAHKQKACLEAGIESFEHVLDKNVKEKEVLKLIKSLNKDKRVSGILVQLPLPKQIDTEKIINAIDPKKDVDGFHPLNAGALAVGKETFLPCTPAGIIELLKYYKIEIAGKHCVVVGRSNIVGKPMAMLMLKENATVTICHGKTDFLSGYTRQADILIVAVGKPNLIKKEDVKEGSVVIDVGINRLGDNPSIPSTRDSGQGKLTGDVDFQNVKDVTSYITPVPGGVGPMTIAMLLKNCVKGFRQQTDTCLPAGRDNRRQE